MIDTLIVQLLLAAMLAPASFRPALPTAMGLPALSVRAPPQVLVNPVEASVIAPGEVGNTSVKPTPVRALLAFVLVSVKIRVETPPGAIAFTAKALESTGAASSTVVAVAGILSVVEKVVSIMVVVPISPVALLV